MFLIFVCYLYFRGPATYIRVGDLDIKSNEDDAMPQDVAIKRTIPYPEFEPPSKYHDIGLIELETPVNLNDYVKVACLDSSIEHNHNMVVMGWGRTEFAGQSSSHLLKADVEEVPQNQCQSFYKNDKDALPNGIVNDLMICAGGESDTCQVVSYYLRN